MIALDTNILIYSHRVESHFYSKAFQIVTELAEGNKPWAIPWPCIHEFYSIVTNKKVPIPPTSIEKAIDQIEAWFESPVFQLIGEGMDHWPLLKTLLLQAHVTGGLVHDARIAAICLSHGVTELWSADRDFSRFGGLMVKNPLIV